MQKRIDCVVRPVGAGQSIFQRGSLGMHDKTMELNETIASYLTGFKDNLDEHYAWEFDPSIPRTRFGVDCVGRTWLARTRELKSGLNNLIASNDSAEQSVPIAEYFIKTWGGIRGFRGTKDTVDKFRDLRGTSVIPADFGFDFASISSWSKWVSLLCPKWAGIYDARVAYAINAINYLYGGWHDIFPTPEGRNTQIKRFDLSTLLLVKKIQPSDVSTPNTLRRKYFVDESAAYKKYVALLGGVSRILWNDGDHIHDVEILLFSLADRQVYADVFKRIQNSNSTLPAVQDVPLSSERVG
jgi:hypothetical protein